MQVVIEQSVLMGSELVTYQVPIETFKTCRRCKGGAQLIMQVHDDEGLIKEQRPKYDVRVWPHDALVVHVYLCTKCGAMRAVWNQG